MDPEPEPLLLFANIEAIQGGHIVALVALLVLLVTSALISGAEVAFFSKHKEAEIEDNPRMDELLENPKKLLATILVSNNFINVGIVILSAFMIDGLFDFSDNPLAGILIQLVGITFVLLLFGEVLPKIYASRKPQRFALFVLPGVYVTYQLLLPLSRLLAKSLDFFKERGGSSTSISVNDLSQALKLANAEKEGDDKMLIDIVKFGNTTVKQIMTPRPDMIAIDDGVDFAEVLALIRDSGYSRLPVYSESIDQISGLLYIKDLLAHTQKEKDFRWKELMRPAFFVPESKKIDDLLQEFRAKKIHLAIVVDEFGGTSGLVTLEDIIEEVVGEINDEFDLETAIYNKVDDYTYIFEGKTPLHEFLRILHVENTDVFDQAKGDSDTLAGFIIEQTGELPQINQSFDFENINFSVETIENRRIQRIKVTLPPHENAK
ncbi:MAG: gliding motility-associated protein GldE [Cryomorphaceae bacterium]|nr:gliding motility-associated protein GldE [Cryomorphaceae bacterium]